jgi:hypothetical protein
MAVQLDLISPPSDPGLDRIERQLSYFVPQLNPPMPFGLLCFPLCPGFGSGRFHSFTIGWRSHNDKLPVSLWSEPEQQRKLLFGLALSYHDATTRPNKYITRCVVCLLVVCLRQRRAFLQGGPLDGPRPPKSARLRARCGARRNMWNLIDPYSTVTRLLPKCKARC